MLGGFVGKYFSTATDTDILIHCISYVTIIQFHKIMLKKCNQFHKIMLKKKCKLYVIYLASSVR